MYCIPGNVVKYGRSTIDAASFLRLAVISQFIRKDCVEISERNVYLKLASGPLAEYLTLYEIPAVNVSKESRICEQVVLFCNQIDSVESFVFCLNDIFPWLLKDNSVIVQLKNDLLALYTALHMLLTCSEAYEGKNVVDGVQINREVYAPRKEKWRALGILDVGTFFQCWTSLNYYQCVEKAIGGSALLAKVIEVYKKNHIPSSVLLTHFSQMSQGKKGIDKTGDLSALHNPWTAWRRQEGLPQPEHGMTLEESLFNEGVMRLIGYGIKATDLINNLFYDGRRDTLVERNILFPTMQLDVGYAERVLVVNPSPDFLIDYSECPVTNNKRTTFVVTDKIVAQAYEMQFADWRPTYNFVGSECFEHCDRLSVDEGKLLPDYDYIVVMMRDSKLELFSNVFRRAARNARFVLFLPQTTITSNSGENILGTLEDNWIRIDNILSLPNELSESGKRKKMIVRAHVEEHALSHFALYTTTYHTLEPHMSQKKGREGKKRRVNTHYPITHYVIPDGSVRHIPYDMLSQKKTIKKMITYYDQYSRPQDTKGEAENFYNKDNKVWYTKDIDITVRSYKARDNKRRLQIYYQYHVRLKQKKGRDIGPEKPGSPERSKHQSVRTAYYEATCSPEKIGACINKWALREDVSELIAIDTEKRFRDHPQDMTLKTAWYCNRKALQGSYLSYDDDLAVDLFCKENHSLHDLALRDITKERLIEALTLTAPESVDDQRYYRLLDLLFRVMVKRHFVDAHPLVAQKTTLDHDRKKAMRQLRDALTKDSLEYGQIFKIVAYLLEPVDERGTPRAVKESVWLIPLIRLCTGMPLREICALRWRDFRQIANLDAYQICVTRLVNDSNVPIPITQYRFVRQYRKVPSVTILSNILIQRRQYVQDQYGVTAEAVMEQPMIYSEEPGAKRVGRKKTTPHCTIRQARTISAAALEKAEIPSKVIDLLDGEASFQEDLNASRNDLYYSNFLHHANNVCGISEGALCYVVGRKGHTCFSEHYIDYRNDFLQLDMIQRLNRLWEKVCQEWRTPMACRWEEKICDSTHTVKASTGAGCLAHLGVSITPVTPCHTCDIVIRVESEHGVEGEIIVFPE